MHEFELIAVTDRLVPGEQRGAVVANAAVAVADDYFRTILTNVVCVCPFCSELVEPLETRMEYVATGSTEEALRAALDKTSFSSASAVRDWTKKLTGLKLGGHSSLNLALEEFERACHVRHCAVHAGGHVGAHNSRVLGVPSGSWISFHSARAIYEIVAVVTATIRAFNQTLFEHILGCWVDQAKLTGDWHVDKNMFVKLWELFDSVKDSESARLRQVPGFYSNAYQAYRPVRAMLLKQARDLE